MDKKQESNGWTIGTLKQLFEEKITALRREINDYKEATNKALELKSAQGSSSSGHSIAIFAALVGAVAAIAAVVSILLHK